MKKYLSYGLVTAILLTALIICGCTGTDNTKKTATYEETQFNPSEKIKTDSFKSEEEFMEFTKRFKESSQQYNTYGLSRQMTKGMAMEETMDGGLDLDVATTNSAPTSGSDYSETNNQVANVDEADIIKTDGEYIYTISGTTLYIIKAYPGEDAEIISTTDFENSPESIFINGDKIAVFGNFYNIEYFKNINFRPSSGMTYFNIYDISDKSKPKLEKEYKFEGSYFKARMVDEYAYFVVRSSPQYRINYPTPIIIEDDIMRGLPVSNIHFYNIPYKSPQFITVHAIDINQPSKDIDSQTVAVEYSQNLYMSENNIFITYTETISEYDIQKEIIKELMDPYLTDADRELIEKIKTVDSDILSQYEKEAKIFAIYETYANYLTNEEQEEMEDKAEEMLKKKLDEYEHLEYTIINKIGIDKNKIEPKANGKVPGHVINQFSMDEDNNIFRIATTLSARWSSTYRERTESSNNVYALDKDMKTIGRLEDLAETESIYATRFIGDRLYMVTFRQVDPFFVIDLSDPKDIKELGKLKIPGFSRYLHPYDKDTIIGIGQDATTSGRTKGLKISLFDVADVENPKEIAKYVTEERYASSTALYEHKAFLFSKDKNLLVIPAYSYEYNRDGTSKGYNGAFVFNISKDEIELRGLIDHSDSDNTYRYYYTPQVERSLYIENLLYTKSPNLLRINALDDLHSVKNISLEKKQTSIPVY